MSIRRALTFPLLATLLSACDVDFTGPGWIPPGPDWIPPDADGSGSSTEIFEWRGQIAPGGTVEIKNINGDVRASSAADGTVRAWELPACRPVASERVERGVTTGSGSSDLGLVAIGHGSCVSLYQMAEIPGYRPAWAVSHLRPSSLQRGHGMS